MVGKKLYYNISSRRYFRRSPQPRFLISNLTYFFFFLLTARLTLSTLIAYVSTQCYDEGSLGFSQSKTTCRTSIVSIEVLETAFIVNLNGILMILAKGYKTLHRMSLHKMKQREFVLLMLLLTLLMLLKESRIIQPIG